MPDFIPDENYRDRQKPLKSGNDGCDDAIEPRAEGAKDATGSKKRRVAERPDLNA